jgi:beta-barrel assembly-enhancing protease
MSIMFINIKAGYMHYKKFTKNIFFIFFLIISLFYSNIAYSMSIKEEEEISKKFLKAIRHYYTFIDDDYIVSYVNEVGKRISEQSGSNAFPFNFYVIKDKTYNAFAGPGGHIFINSGLFAGMEGEEELAGIFAHEIAHVACRHISQKIERNTKIQIATIAGMIAGIFLGVSGSGAGAEAVAAGSIAAGQSFALAYSREDETQADQFAMHYLKKTGYSGAGLVEMLKKIREKEWLEPYNVPVYLMTHPSSKERILYLSNMLDKSENKKSMDKPENFDKTYNFKMAHIRLLALYTDFDTAKKHIYSLLEKNKEDTYYNYGYGLILAKERKTDKAFIYFKKALEEDPFNPYILKDFGKALFLSGEYQKANDILTNAMQFIPNNKDGLFYVGMANLKLDNYWKSIDIFKGLIEKEADYLDAYYYLAEAYTRINKKFDAHYNLGIYYKKQNKLQTAAFHFKKAIEKANDDEHKKQAQELLDKIPKRKRNR